ncbi:hypothetical protein BG015_009452 [Linnemannia schmuckeri]|uniref:Uncharacterized protein n=1 Tax=Linnemannia schmuckeri TaxID=64567 RepID=A0A9P5V9C8_9FUNG|nr:hypothetical protein BG015_009452 [Linnemannia schmuckeri]
MTRSLSIILFAAVAAVAMMASQTVDAQASKPQCAPIHNLYKTYTNKCTQSGASIPNSDADPRWRECICQPGFFPVAQEAEKCVLSGVNQTPSITPAGLDNLCKGFANYVPAATQKAPDTLAPAVASASALAAALPTGSTGAGGNGGSGTSGAYRMADGSSSVVMVGMTAFAAVVLATAAAF